MDWFSQEHLTHLIATYGYLAIAVIIGLESMGLPLPGESALVIAALYASRHDKYRRCRGRGCDRRNSRRQYRLLD